MAATEPKPTEDEERARIAAQIAKGNDAFRAALFDGGNAEFPGKYLLTQGVHAKGPEFGVMAQLAVAGDANFTEDNDPYGDHSMGAVEVCGEKVWWKIDLYDTDFRYGPDDPLDESQVCRVLTILFPHEY